ncbi:MAG: hypothetical protein Q9169_001110 [Polycauliona sp. 2 TL-2023]
MAGGSICNGPKNLSPSPSFSNIPPPSSSTGQAITHEIASRRPALLDQHARPAEFNGSLGWPSACRPLLRLLSVMDCGLEIEERYPRNHDPREPRRRRLNFVRSSSRSRRNSSSSDDYALMHSTFVNARPIRAEERERHDPRMLQQQEHAFRQMHGQNQEMHQRLQWHENEMRQRQQIEQAQFHHHQQQQQQQQQQQHMLQHGHGHPPPPPPPPFGPHHHQQQHQLHNQPHHHDGFPPGIEPVHHDEHANMIDIAPRPRSRMPSQLRHGGGRSPSRGRSHRRHHSGASIYSDERDDYAHVGRRHNRSPVVYGSSHDSFDDLMATHNPGIQRVVGRRR